MRRQINVHEAKSQLSRLIASAEAGEEVIIARANKPVVRLLAIAQDAQSSPNAPRGDSQDAHPLANQTPRDRRQILVARLRAEMSTGRDHGLTPSPEELIREDREAR